MEFLLPGIMILGVFGFAAHVAANDHQGEFRLELGETAKKYLNRFAFVAGVMVCAYVVYVGTIIASH